MDSGHSEDRRVRPSASIRPTLQLSEADLERRLCSILEVALHQPVGLVKLTRTSAGASQETWLLDLDQAPPQRLVLRRAPGGAAAPRMFAAGLEAEAQLMTLAAECGVPAPHVIHLLSPDDGIGQGFIMRFVAGETIPRKILRDPRFANALPTLAARCGEILAKIHSMPHSECPPLRLAPASVRLQELRLHYLGQNAPRPILELGFQWLQHNLPTDQGKPVLVHGDFRNGNLIINESGVSAVLDWELAHFGDAAEDLGWLCVPSWRYGVLDKPVGGFGETADLLSQYRQTSGRDIPLLHLRYWIVFGVLFWAVACQQFALDYLAGDRTPERAMIGRRTSEAELDLLKLIQENRANANASERN